MKEIKVMNIVKLYTLLLLYRHKRYGYEIIKEVHEKMGKKASPGQIYPFLNTLKKQGFVVSKKAGARDKRSYKITPKGKIFVNRMLKRFGDLIDIAVKPKINVCAHCGCEVYKGSVKVKIKGATLAFCCKHCLGSYKRIK